MKADQAANLANAFGRAAARCEEQRPLGPGQVEMLLVPAVVCGAFSIELGLKALALRSGKHLRGHDLSKLFDELADDDKAKIVHASGVPADQVAALLPTIAKAFEQWRYVYEGESANINFKFLTRLHAGVMAALAQ